jgi:hypothetical protein
MKTRNITYRENVDMRKYNGWTNYETWLCASFLLNDEGAHEYWTERARETYRWARPPSYSTKLETAKYELAKAMKEDHLERMPEVEGFFGGIMLAGLKEVNFDEIAGHYFDDIDEDEDEETEEDYEESEEEETESPAGG